MDEEGGYRVRKHIAPTPTVDVVLRVFGVLPAAVRVNIRIGRTI